MRGKDFTEGNRGGRREGRRCRGLPRVARERLRGYLAVVRFLKRAEH